MTEQTQQIDQIQLLTQDAVREVFRSMVSMDLSVVEPFPLPADSAGQIIGSVGFIGEASGVICLYAGVTFGKAIASQMLGIPIAEVDGGDTVNDTIGELSNMVAGYVKSRLCDGGWRCVLTIPSIVRGQEMSVEGSGGVMRKVIGFRNSEYCLLAEILLKEPEKKEL